MKLKKKISLVFLGLFLGLLLLELICRFLPVRDLLPTLPVDAENPVIRYQENMDVIWSRGSGFSIVTKKHVNNYGFLNDQNYHTEGNSPLMAIVGDSYVEAFQVENKHAMHGILSQETGDAGRIYSFGVSGSPLSNYLAYAKYAVSEFNANALVFMVVGNDFDESCQKYKNSPGMHYFSNLSGRMELVRIDYQPTIKNRLSRKALSASSLLRYLVLNAQLSHRSITRIFNTSGDDEDEFVGNTLSGYNRERITDSQVAVDRFFEELPLLTELKSNEILFVVDGMRPHLYDAQTLSKAKGSYFDLMRKYFIGQAMEKGYEVIDMQPVFLEKHQLSGTRFEFPTDGHWNESGHELVAEKIKASAVYSRLFK
jgi:hypothetical protein